MTWEDVERGRICSLSLNGEQGKLQLIDFGASHIFEQMKFDGVGKPAYLPIEEQVMSGKCGFGKSVPDLLKSLLQEDEKDEKLIADVSSAIDMYGVGVSALWLASGGMAPGFRELWGRSICTLKCIHV